MHVWINVIPLLKPVRPDEAGSSQQRLFIAVDPSADTVARVSEFLEALKKKAHRGHAGLKLSWSNAEKFHLTLKFLGSVSADMRPEIEASLERIASATEAFRISLQGTGAFPERGTARVLWAGVSDPERKLAALAEAVEQFIAPLGFPRENRPFAPHLTLARVKEGKDARKLLDGSNALEFGEFSVNEIVLYESKLHPGGSAYLPIARYRFGRR